MAKTNIFESVQLDLLKMLKIMIPKERFKHIANPAVIALWPLICLSESVTHPCKKCKYLQACQDQRITFTPFCVSVDGMLGSEAEFFVTRLTF